MTYNTNILGNSFYFIRIPYISSIINFNNFLIGISGSVHCWMWHCFVTHVHIYVIWSFWVCLTKCISWSMWNCRRWRRSRTTTNQIKLELITKKQTLDKNSPRCPRNSRCLHNFTQYLKQEVVTQRTEAFLNC